MVLLITQPIEEAVRRELMEEASVKVGEVSYWATQPWPFPSSLMIGFTARATSDTLTVDHDELAEAHWFSRDELLAAIKARDIMLPPPVSIARHIIEAWFGAPLPSTWTEPRGPRPPGR